ncbi:hypothetical protein [uncultured Sphingomonas sp.]|uniref:hypothetical protein n=1 Tax=uncultured Sphingomonas sp. TaxID=158754 RepID=UPI0037495B13
MSNAAVIRALDREFATIAVSLDRVSARMPTSWSASAIDSARGHLAQARFDLSVAIAAGVDPVIEVAAA